jgi:hypothetical protein
MKKKAADPFAAITIAACALAFGGAATAQETNLEGVVDHLMAYMGSYPARLASVIADERYNQRTESVRAGLGGPTNDRSGDRTIKSDYALTRVSGEWIAYRDAYEVDGVKVRDRNDRLARLVSNSGSPEEMAAILTENAKFNLAGNRVSRNINIPTLVISLLHPRNRARFVFTKGGEETVDTRRLWRVNFQERTLPTLVHRADNQDQPVAGSVWADPITGEVWRTNLTWAKGPGGNIAVTYEHVPDIEPLVPLKMSEKYVDGSTEIRGEATYSKFRQFRTSGRLLAPE